MVVTSGSGLSDDLPVDVRQDANVLLAHLANKGSVSRETRVEESLLWNLQRYLRLETILGQTRPRDDAPHPEIAGFGLFAVQDQAPRTAIVSYRDEVRGRVLELHEEKVVAESLGETRAKLLTNPLVIGLPPPVPQASCGSELWADRQGSAGALVDRDGQIGILTAGHVATTVGTQTYLDRSAWGSVVFTTHGTPNPADVAVVGRAEGIVALSKCPQPTSIRLPALGDQVSSFGAETCATANVMGILPFQWFPSLGRNLAEVLLTAAPISRSGDSGALVLITNSQEMVGHVVGGDRESKTYTSVQLAAFILNAASCNLV